MKIWKFILCVLALCLCFAGCDSAGDDTPETTPATTPSTTPADVVDTTPVAAETTPAPAVMIEIVANGQSEYTVIRSDKADDGKVKLFSAFFSQLCGKTGCTLKFTESIDRIEADPAAKEILLGTTNRAESIALEQKLTAAGGTRFGISMSENKLAIAGTSTYQIYLGLDYLLNNFASGDEGSATLALEQGFEYISEDNGQAAFTVDSLLAMDKGISFVVTETLIKKIPAKSPGYSVMQGGGTDGKYAYIGLINKSVTPEKALIYKYDLETLELVKTSQPLETAHTNDITYDSKNHRLIISRCTADDGYRGISIVDPDTLELIENKIVPVVSRALDYIPETDQYLFASNWTLTLTDANFNAISAFTCNDPQYTTQGCYCDGKYTYDVRYVSGSQVHYIVIHTLDGKYIGTMPVYGLSGAEPEHMFVYNGTFIMGCNKTNSLYTLEMLPVNWW